MDRINDEYEDDLRAISEKDAQRFAAQFLNQMNVLIYSIGAIAAIISSIVIMNVMFMSVRERTREIGTMKAIGATDRQILGAVMGEAVSIALIGGLIGIGLSFLAIQAINAVIAVSAGVVGGLAMITPRLFIGAILFASLLGVVGGALPARKAAKIDPIEALRYE